MRHEFRGGEHVLSGAIDENADLAALVAQAKNGRLALELSGITFINSPGVREWIRMQQAAAAAKVNIELRRVAVPIVHQLNIVVATRGVSLVSSFYAPYDCEECDREHQMLLDVRLHGSDLARMKPPLMKCPDCRAEMVFPNPPELYFLFLSGG